MSQTGVFVRRIVTISMLVLAAGVGVLANSILGFESTGDTSSMALSTSSPTIGAATLEKTLDPADDDAVFWAQDRYWEAGLSLPDMRVSFHDNSTPCEGAQGGHRIKDGVSQVLICISELGPSRELKLKRTLLHEFAHAWDTHFLTQDAREEFMNLRSLEGWSFEVSYEERGSEAAAETITWGLMDEPLLFGSLDTVTPWHVQHEGYLALTGVEPPHGYVWSLFAAGHDVYAYTPSQVEIVKRAWELSEDEGRLTERIEVRFHKDVEFCGGGVASSELIGDRLHVQVCPGSESELTAALLDTLTGAWAAP